MTSEKIFYEIMWRAHACNHAMPLPWWVQQYFRHWFDFFDSGLFDDKHAAFASNAFYRYWNMVGVKNHKQESLVGQFGEIEPVYDEYCLSFFIYDQSKRRIHSPNAAKQKNDGSYLRQELQDKHLPVVFTEYVSSNQVRVKQKVLATTVGRDEKSVVLADYTVTGGTADIFFGVALTPFGPTGFHRRDRAGRFLNDRSLRFIRYLPMQCRTEINTSSGPVFSIAPSSYGVYGSPFDPNDPDKYLDHNPFNHLVSIGSLNNTDFATDNVHGLATAAFLWKIPPEGLSLDIRLPIDRYTSAADFAELKAPTTADLTEKNVSFWKSKLSDGLQLSLPAEVAHLSDLYKICRSNLLILSDNGAIHPGPTIYDSFWIRDSSVEGIACALAGDSALAENQFGIHYPNAMNQGSQYSDSVCLDGFFGHEHEINDREWDSNGQALWAFGRFDRILGHDHRFGAKVYNPCITKGAAWIRDNRSQYGLLHHGWSAEHIGEKDKPHYWDDMWALAGLWEAAKLTERIGEDSSELWSIYEKVCTASRNSILWTLGEQKSRGVWETFIPTGPSDVGRGDSTMVGTIAYFHPCRLYMGAKLGPEVDYAARMTLETIYHRHVDGGIRHSPWNAYGPYLTIQLAHAFLLIGDRDKMDRCLSWAVHNAAFAKTTVNPFTGDSLVAVQGCWNEQHCYTIAKDFQEKPQWPWYMGDIPHGWACAEFMLLLRDILFFEADEDGTPHIYLAPGIMPHWLKHDETIEVRNAPTILGGNFGFIMRHDKNKKTLFFQLLQHPQQVTYYVFSCPFGPIIKANGDGGGIEVTSTRIHVPSGTRSFIVEYA